MTRFSDGPVVVPVDMSAESLAAVDVALQIAASANRIHVLRILHEPHSSHPDALVEAIDHSKWRNAAIKELQASLADEKYADLKLCVEFGDRIHHTIACFSQQPVNLTHQFAAVDPLIARIGIGEMPADISQGSCPQQCITQSMQQHIRIRMTQQPFLIRNGHSPDDEITPNHQRMNIKPLSDSDFFHSN